MSSGRCWSSDTYNPVPGVMEGVPSGNNYQGGFGTQLMAKVGLISHYRILYFFVINQQKCFSIGDYFLRLFSSVLNKLYKPLGL